MPKIDHLTCAPETIAEARRCDAPGASPDDEPSNAATGPSHGSVPSLTRQITLSKGETSERAERAWRTPRSCVSRLSAEVPASVGRGSRSAPRRLGVPRRTDRSTVRCLPGTFRPMDGLATFALTGGTELLGPFGVVVMDPISISDSRDDDDLRPFADAMHGLVDMVVSRFRHCSGDPDDITDRVDVLLVDRDYHERWRKCSTLVPLRSVVRAMRRRLPPIPEWPSLSTSVRDDIRLACRADHETIRAMLRAIPDSVDVDGIGATMDQDPLAPVYLDAVPVKVREGLVGRQVADLCGLALRGLLHRTPWPPEQVMAELARLWLDGARRFLAFVQSLGHAPSADAEVLPPSYRFSLHDAVREMHESMEALAYATYAAEQVHTTGHAFPPAPASDDAGDEDENG